MSELEELDNEISQRQVMYCKMRDLNFPEIILWAESENIKSMERKADYLYELQQGGGIVKQ